MQCIENGRKYVKSLSLPDILPDENSRSCAVQIIEDFDNNIELLDVKKPRVGVVGEILVKFLPAANNHLVDLLESEGAEAVVPDLLDFLQYCFYNQNFKVEKLGFAEIKSNCCKLGHQGHRMVPRSGYRSI